MDESFMITNVDLEQDNEVIPTQKDKKRALKLFIKDVQELQPHPNLERFYIYCDVAVQLVHIRGIITETRQCRNKIMYLVDDGTGEVWCTYDHTRHVTENQGIQHVMDKLSDLEATSLNDIDTLNDTVEHSGTFETLEIELMKSIKECWQTHTESKLNLAKPFVQGDSIFGYGKVINLREERQIWLYDVRLVTDIDEETIWQLDLIYLYNKHYNKSLKSDSTQ